MLFRSPLSAIRSAWAELFVRPPGQLPALDGLRATAVLLVVCSHYTEEFGQRVIPAVKASWFSRLPIFYWGWTGVDLFFVLSGFLIGRQIWRERFSTGTVNFPRFFLRRGFRIWPLYFAMLLLFAFLGHPLANRWDLLFLSNYFQGGFDRGWSLSTEEQFYILVPLFVIATAFFSRAREYSVTLGVFVVAVLFARRHATQVFVAQGFAGYKLTDALYTPFHLHCEPLIAGLAIALLSVSRPDWIKAQIAKGGLSRVGLSVFVACSVLGVGLRTFDKNVFPFTALGLIYGSLAFWLLLDASWVNRAASWRGFYPVSRLSYGMYLNHFYVAPGLTAWTITSLRALGAPETIWFWTGLFVACATSMAVAAVTFFAVERPFLRARDAMIPGTHP